MSQLSQLDFHVLNALADGSEPFSMIYQDAAEFEVPEWNIKAVAISICGLLSRGMLEFCGFDVQEHIEFVLDPDTLSTHYHSLERELEEMGRPFYYSQGEYFFQMTKAGRMEWKKEEYRPFYTEGS